MIVNTNTSRTLLFLFFAFSTFFWSFFAFFGKMPNDHDFHVNIILHIGDFRRIANEKERRICTYISPEWKHD